MKPETIEIIANGTSKLVATPITLEEFVCQAGFQNTQIVVEYNGQVLNRKTWYAVTLQEGDQIELIVPVAGG